MEIHPNERKEKEKGKERGGRKEEKTKKQALVVLLVFIMAKLTEEVKNPARCTL